MHKASLLYIDQMILYHAATPKLSTNIELMVLTQSCACALLSSSVYDFCG